MLDWARWLLRLAFAFALAVGLGYLPYRAWGPAGVGRAARLDRQLDELRRGNRELRHDSLKLRREIARLKSNRRAIEHAARDELGLVRPNDIVFDFSPPPARRVASRSIDSRNVASSADSAAARARR
ncbi:MAG: septum formation initiator family protein [Myxococcales bacterium]|nr:septum formation initiator family protein [Myxococcales bacterium]